MSTYNLQIKSVYDFSMKAGAILGFTYKAATVLGILDFDSAKQLEDVASIHASVYSELAVGTPKKASELIYVKLKTSTGAIRVFAMDWIASQPVPVTATTANVKIFNVNLADLDTIRQVLVGNGFSQIEITTA